MIYSDRKTITLDCSLEIQVYTWLNSVSAAPGALVNAFAVPVTALEKRTNHSTVLS